MFDLFHYLPSQSEQVSKFVYSAFEKNVLIGVITMLSFALVVVFVKWQRDASKFLKETQAHRKAVEEIVGSFNERISDKDEQVLKFAREVTDAVNDLKRGASHDV